MKTLKTLCICTFTWSGTLALFGLLGMIFTNFFGDLITNIIPIFGGSAGSVFKVLFFLIFFTYAMSVAGAIGMFRLKRNGFFLYLLPNMCELFFQLYFITKMFTAFTVLYLLVSILFIFLYALKLKFMS